MSLILIQIGYPAHLIHFSYRPGTYLSYAHAAPILFNEYNMLSKRIRNLAYGMHVLKNNYKAYQIERPMLQIFISFIFIEDGVSLNELHELKNQLITQLEPPPNIITFLKQYQFPILGTTHGIIHLELSFLINLNIFTL